MQVTAISSRSSATAQASSVLDKVKQSFQSLGTALESGNLSDAKDALTQLQKKAPAQAGNTSNPIGTKMEVLSKAVDSGDLKAAKAAYADIKKTLSERPATGSAPTRGAGGPPPSGGGKSSSASGSSSKVYDKKDANKDGTVSWKEEQDYDLKHPDEAKQAAATAATAKVNSDQGVIDALA